MDEHAPTLRFVTLAQVSLDSSLAPHLHPGDRIGPFVLERLLGSGGMGQVFLATQLEPVQRPVALKFMHGAWASGTGLARFLIERQALARMQHPAIAQVYEAGTTADGFPYLAMEPVDGLPIHHHCRRHELDLRARLQLFLRVCQGVAHAHQKGVVHRDLKPRNILVTRVDGEAAPKLIDFGIATAVQGDATEPTRRVPVGTPGYMSPEQLAGDDDIDTRSDVHALGAVLYLLLSGSPAVPRAQLQAAGADSGRLRQMLARQVLIPPSRQVFQTPPRDDPRIARDARRWSRQLRPELDAIVARALHVDRNQRYQSCGELQEDLQRWLQHRPVRAMPDRTRYRLRCLWRRQRTAISLGVLALAGLLTALGLTTWALLEAREQRARASAREQQLASVADFQRSMLEQIDPVRLGQHLTEALRNRYGRRHTEWPGLPVAPIAFAEALAHADPPDAARSLLAAEVLQPAEAAIAGSFADQPQVAAALESGLASAYAGIGLQAPALSAQLRAVSRLQDALGSEAPETLLARIVALELQLGSGQARTRLAEAEHLVQATVAPFDPDHHARAERVLARLLGELGDRSEAALTRIGAVVQRQQAQYGEHDPRTQAALEDQATLLALATDYAAAVQVWDRLARLRGIESESPPLAALSALENKATSLARLGELEQAQDLQRKALAQRRKLLGDTHPSTLDAMSNLAVTGIRLGELDASAELLEQTLAQRLLQWGPTHPITLRNQLNLASVRVRQGDLAWLHSGSLDAARAAGMGQAETLYLDVLQRRRALLGPAHPDTQNVLLNVADLYYRQERHREALPYARELLQHRTATFPASDPRVLEARVFYGRALQSNGECAQALPLLQDTLTEILAQPSPTTEWVDMTAWALAQCQAASGDPAAAERTLHTHLERLLGAEPMTSGGGRHLWRAIRAWRRLHPPPR